MVSDELLEEIRAQADLTQIVGEYVQLRRSGRTYRGPCPLHGGEGPNFSVDPERGIFKCFVCGEGGDVFSFPMKLLGLDFIEAVKFVAERVGVVVPEVEREEEDPYRDIREAVALRPLRGNGAPLRFRVCPRLVAWPARRGRRPRYLG